MHSLVVGPTGWLVWHLSHYVNAIPSEWSQTRCYYSKSLPLCAHVIFHIAILIETREEENSNHLKNINPLRMKEPWIFLYSTVVTQARAVCLICTTEGCFSQNGGRMVPLIKNFTVSNMLIWLLGLIWLPQMSVGKPEWHWQVDWLSAIWKYLWYTTYCNAYNN